ncbi:hypothetical protein SY2F82_77390 [Streptomyces sp. Y2F8-2]|nr:hypothetical protein SY2F82_77390 [Streptomyces sp. Y2F8-2]
MAGYRVRCVLATKAVNGQVEAADEKQLTKTRPPRPRRPALHRLGYRELGRRGAEFWPYETSLSRRRGAGGPGRPTM